jgi:ribosomal protein S27AE
MGEDGLFEIKDKNCTKCGSKTIFRDTKETFCGDCGHIVESKNIVDAVIDDQLKLKVGKIYSSRKLEEMVRGEYKDLYFFMNTILNSDRIQTYFKVLPKVSKKNKK